jgi:hypothetical protein
MADRYTFNTTPVAFGPRVEYHQAMQHFIEATPNLRRASLSNAALFGGPLVKRCLEVAPLVGDRAHVIVDTKVSMLMPTWLPAIPGWHTDGVPRRPAADNGLPMDPSYTGQPSLKEQKRQADGGYFPRYHTIHVGNDCPTYFVAQPLELDLEHGESDQLYAEMTRLVQELRPGFKAPSPGRWMSWDWWNIHAASEAVVRGWRLLIRVTESNTPPAETGFIRAQNQVYVPREFGW